MSNPDWFHPTPQQDLSLRDLIAIGNIDLADLDETTLDLLVQSDWKATRRPSQTPPDWDWFVFLFLGGRGGGKALHVDTPIPTPDGWKPIGDLVAGDRLFDEAGRCCTVVEAHAPYTTSDVYEIVFSDGATLVADGAHQWVTWTHAERKAFLRSTHEPDRTRFPDEWPRWRLTRQMGPYGAPKVYPQSPGPQVRTTSQIRDTLTFGARGDTNHCVPTCGPLQLPDRVLPIDPYVLGVWLGDGSGGRINKPDLDLYHNIAAIRPVSQFNTVHNAFTVYGLLPELRALGLLGNKHVPDGYLRGSVGQRLALLQGLMDTTDGGVETPGSASCSVTTTDRQLFVDVCELVASLGMRYTTDSRQPKLSGAETSARTGKRHKTAYRINFRPTMQVFRLPRKADLLNIVGQAQQLRHRHRMIVDVRPASAATVRCITVNSPNRMYLAGRAMIPTHNTATASEQMADWAVEHGPGFRGAVVAPTLNDARVTCFEGESGLKHSIPPRLLKWPGDWERSFNRSTVELFLQGEGKIQGYSSEKADRLRGPQHHKAWVDEASSLQDAAAGPMADTTWFNLIAGMRLEGPPHVANREPQVLVTTTPKPNALTRYLADDNCPLKVARHRVSSLANLSNLAATYIETVIKPYLGTRLGMQELEALIVEGNGDVFDLTNLRSRPSLPSDTDRFTFVRYWDLAATEPHEGNPNPDWTVGTLAALDLKDHEHHYVVDSRWVRLRPGRRNETIVATAVRDVEDYGHVQYWFELEGGSGGVAQQAEFERLLTGIVPVHSNRPASKKHERAELPAASIEQGRVTFIDGDWTVAAREQLAQMTTDDSHDHDDFVDTLSGLWAVMSQIAPPVDYSGAPIGDRKESNR